MTASDWNKILKQLKKKPEKRKKFLKHNKPKARTTGIAKQKCEKCGRFGGHLSQYNINLCRHCFREIAEEMGFKKYS
ncbi:30S ribosomal protein S14 [Candidatus Pacearchaeota archaeon CG10_big_fil_rev_8_21_14_0_10_35_219]|nr:30S ribosomal protein S14 [Candidatus Pacearchaeota archaeon]PIO07458.1 MAG: 30S ribosomal protein S14 [Candidatus Pacearchaeota archaeon CG10_big_fil_rev_8_21_14_0_10_35_219]PIY81264.1 MAG: 30S ribosomal protein S14 [Candidatus Pacearchaeota archaeon CG_4_10_14_0_8_um_filter_35_169]PIZ80193.1 MAG: 30S ribosomal protein S14 [Candidatus Pacearchaeota archaeon CG_4_10_14_0_2_um_filter_35_33]PJA69542.1 MAG: 30S ribosomal protein S14 [Candidatus Pacearchaeota archaeon CG_4_9_14_3_um_filter_35_19